VHICYLEDDRSDGNEIAAVKVVDHEKANAMEHFHVRIVQKVNESVYTSMHSARYGYPRSECYTVCDDVKPDWAQRLTSTQMLYAAPSSN
jgi:hypothetical protein